VRVQLVDRRSTQGGAIAVLVALLAVVLFAMAAFVVDFGMAYANKRQLQTAADAASLAGAHEILRQSSGNDDCGAMESHDAEAKEVALDYLKDNRPTTGGRVVEDDVKAQCEGDRLFVYASTEYERSTFLGGLLGVDKLAVSREARAVVAPTTSVIGVRPFGVCKDIANLIRDEPTVIHEIAFNNDGTSCGKASGNWGLLYLDEDASGLNDLKPWVEHGYPEHFTIPESGSVVIPGKTGSPSGLPIDKMLGDDSVIPIYDEITGGSGVNADFHITGFLGITLHDYRNSGSTYYFKVQYNGFAPVGELSEWCTLNDDCDTGVRVVKLVD
jgi:hypothetical protein